MGGEDQEGAYQRFLTPGSVPFDPLELAKQTENIITRRGPEGLERKYTGIYSAPVYPIFREKIELMSDV